MFRKEIRLIIFFFSFICVSLPVAGQQVARAKELKLIMATYIPPRAYKDLTLSLMSFADYVNEHGKGVVQIKYYHSGSLLRARELLPGLMQGTADIILHTDSYMTGTYPILGIFELPFLYRDTGTAYKKLKTGSALYQLINQELAKKNVFMLATLPAIPEYIWTKDKPIRKPEDLKGLRIRTAGRLEAMAVRTLGGASTTLSSGEVYEAMSRGTVDGVLCYVGTILARGLQEKAEYVTKTYLASYGAQLLIRLDKWNSLDPDVRRILSAAGRHFEKQFPQLTVPYWNKHLWPQIEKAGITEITLTSQEEELLRKKIKPLWNWWKKQLPPGLGEKAIRLAVE